jgi:hypothetical protein
MCGKDAYVNLNITEVKIEKGWPNSNQKRGYYKGNFDAVLYAANRFGAPEKKTITRGQFMAPIRPSNCSSNALMGSAPTQDPDRRALLTSGRWYFKSISGFNFPLCNLDDYIVLRPDATFAWVENGVKCGSNEGEIDYIDDKRMSWTLIDNSVIRFDFLNDHVEDWLIVGVTETELKISLDGGLSILLLIKK